MKLLNIKFIILFILFLSSTISYARQEDVKNLLNENIISLVRDNNASIIYAASSNSIYKTADSGRTWNKIYNTTKINKLYSDYTKSILYVLTESGLYRSKDAGINWQLVFKGNSDMENNCLCLAASQKVIYLGTKEGLFISYDQGNKWHKATGQFSKDIISSVVMHPQGDNIIYIASNGGVFITEDNGQAWKRVYVVYGSEIPEEDYFEYDYDDEYNDKVVTIYDMAISHKEPYRLYIACKNGIFFTDDKGNTWKQIKNIGLKSLVIRSIKVSDDSNDVFVVTKKGAFGLEGGIWQNINSGIGYGDFYDLTINENNQILISGMGGIYEVKIAGDSPNIDSQKEEFNDPIDSGMFKGEPSIEDIQRAAIKYADVDINKIMNWRKQSRVKALCPDINVSYDKTIYGSSTGQMAVGPRDWSLGLSWDIADLIWNSDETSIDSRSRLTVQLRQDVLDQVTRLYYERRRLETEMLFTPLKDKKEKIIKLLEIEEVTASLDALTNGYFSKSNQQIHP